MKNKPDMEFQCLDCTSDISFSVSDMDSLKEPQQRIELQCAKCGKKYAFEPKLSDQLHRFHALILAVQNAKEIIGNIHVGVSINGHSVKIPYRLLLTRMNPTVKLNIGGQELNFKFRVEPLND